MKEKGKESKCVAFMSNGWDGKGKKHCNNASKQAAGTDALITIEELSMQLR